MITTNTSLTHAPACQKWTVTHFPPHAKVDNDFVKEMLNRLSNNTRRTFLNENDLNEVTATVKQDRKEVMAFCKEELRSLLGLGCRICNLRCTKSGIDSLCAGDTRSMRASYVQDSSDDNLKKIAWLFYVLPTSTYKAVQENSMTHQLHTEFKFMQRKNIRYHNREAMDYRNRTCIQEMYSKVINEIRGNLMKTPFGGKQACIMTKRPQSILHEQDQNKKKEKGIYYVIRDGNLTTTVNDPLP